MHQVTVINRKKKRRSHCVEACIENTNEETMYVRVADSFSDIVQASKEKAAQAENSRRAR